MQQLGEKSAQIYSFGLGAEAAGYCTSHVRCVALCLIPFASYFPFFGLFQGASEALYSTFVATSALAIRVISTYVLQEIPAIGYNMIWWNSIFGWGIGCIITWVHFLRGKWKQKTGMSNCQTANRRRGTDTSGKGKMAFLHVQERRIKL